jgi:hypothetical protein
MKTNLGTAVLMAVFALCMSCASNDISSKMTYYHGQKIPDEFFALIEWAPDHVSFEIRVDFKTDQMYHLILDESGVPLSEGWYPTVIVGRSYTVTMKSKPGSAFEAEKRYRLCIGGKNPEEVYITSNNYRCSADYEFALKVPAASHSF